MTTEELTACENDVQRSDSSASAAQAWLRDHSVAAVAVGVTLMAAAGYCVHRSWLFGWYQASGIPSFAHSWSVQDVVMQGITNLYVWLFGLVAVTLMGVAIYIEVLLIAAAEKWLDRYLARRKKASDEVGDEEVPRKTRGKLGTHAAICGLFVAGAVLLYTLIAFAVFLFSAQPRKLGHAQFVEMEKAANITIKGAVPSLGARPTKQEVEDASEYMLARSRYVQTMVGFGDAAERHCGWLVLQNGEHMLLLTRSGPLFLSASGLGFSWRPTKIEDC